MFVNVIEMSSVAFHGPLVTENVVPVVAVFSTETEGSGVVLWNVDSKSAVCGEMLLAQPAGGASVVTSELLDKSLSVLGDPTGLC